jgi:hypothetical protein
LMGLQTNKLVVLVAGGIWLLAGLAVACLAAGEEIRVSCRQDEVFRSSASPLARVYLARRPVLRASETVTLDGVILARDQGYWIDYAEGIIYLKSETEPGRTLQVAYSVLPFTLRPAYQLRTLEPSAGRPAEKPIGIAPLGAAKSPYDLRASGSKIISLEAGSITDLRVSQALNLSIGGKIGEAVEVRGMLSDKDMTLSDRTSTARLEDLDRVFIEVRSPQAYARVGDLEINEAPGELLSFKRNLTGFLGDASHGPGRLVLSGAQSRGRYETIELVGQEGIAGPYRIGAREGEDLGLVANSEKVWLDGEPMKRGRNADYLIDYTAGEIYFNPSHLIRDGMKIAVDYESRSESSQRQFYFARSSVGLGKHAAMAVSFLNEGAEGVASDAELDPLFAGGETSGDGAADLTDGGKYVGLGAGDYIKVTRDSSVCYEYAGEGGGDYEVTFTWVGEDKGEYSYLFSERWQREVHVFTGSGAYTDDLVTPRRLTSQIVHVNASARPADGLEVTSEFAQSRGQKMSAGGTWDLARDRAYLVGLKGAGDLPQVGGRMLGEMEVAARRRWIGQGYLAVTRLGSPGALERWAQDPAGGAEATNEMSLTYRLGTRLAASAELGSLATPSGDSRRQKLAIELGGPRLGLSANSETAGLAGAAGTKGVERTAVAVRFPVKFVDFSLGRTSDARRRLVDSTSVERTEYHSGARLTGRAGSVALALTASSEAKDKGAGWGAYSSALDGKLEFETDQARRLAVRGQVAHRDVTYAPAAELGRRRMTSADLGLNLRDVLALSSVALDYGLANTLTSVYSTRLVKVGAGGDYDSLGNYTPGAGTHEITRYESGKQPVARMKTALTVETGLKGKILLERTLSSRTTLELEGETSKPNLAGLALANPAFILDEDQVVFGRASFGEELVISRLRGLTLALTAGLAKSLDARCTGRTEKDLKTRLEARLTTTGLRKTTASAAWRLTSNRRTIKTGAALIDPSSRIWVAGANLERAFSSTLRGRMGAEVSGEGRSQPRSSILEGSLSSGLTVFWGTLRCDAGASVRRLLGSEAASRVLVISRDSVDWNSRVNLRQGKYTSLAFEYVGRKARDVPTLHNVRASLSATF